MNTIITIIIGITILIISLFLIYVIGRIIARATMDEKDNYFKHKFNNQFKKQNYGKKEENNQEDCMEEGSQ